MLASLSDKEKQSVEELEEKFVEIKEAFDKLIDINNEYKGQLLSDPEAELAESIELQARQA